VRREFTGSRTIFAILALTGIGVPFAVLYLVDNTVEIHTRVENGEEAFAKIQAGHKAVL
jgi:hypothetical protein